VLQVVGGALAAYGYEVYTAGGGREALSIASDHPPDVTVLDLGLPDLDGVQVCQALRRWTNNPIIVLTADGSDERKVAALDEGADDYLTKPFSMNELLARVRVALRHRSLMPALDDERIFRAGDLWLDRAGHQAGTATARLALTAKEFALLAILMSNSGRVLTHRTLLDRVWGGERDLATLRTHMAQLRRKLRAIGSTVDVLAESGVGYRLTEGSL
jgi:two-component system KDP operon response regulator KdpE